MKAGKVFRKTLPFCMAKLALGGATVLISTILLAIMLFVGGLFGDGGIFWAIVIWLSAVGVIRFALMHYIGYMVKAGHIAVMTEAFTEGKVPANQVKYGIGKVKERFVTANVYFAVDKLVTGSVKQIQRGIERLGQKMDFVPGMEHLTKLVNFFIELSLGYIDECCLGYTFYKKEQGAFESACDGVVIYAKNIKKLLGNAAKTMLKVILLCIATVLLVFIPVGLLFKLLSWNTFIAFLLACLITWTLKFAFLDSYILCQTMAGYMAVAPTTELSFDLYEKLSGISDKFKELMKKKKEEKGTSAQETTEAQLDASTEQKPLERETLESEALTEQTDEPEQTAVQQAITAFCSHCGTKRRAGAVFCGNCGTKIE